MSVAIGTRHSPTADHFVFRHPAEGAEKGPSNTKLFLVKGRLKIRVTLVTVPEQCARGSCNALNTCHERCVRQMKLELRHLWTVSHFEISRRA